MKMKQKIDSWLSEPATNAFTFISLFIFYGLISLFSGKEYASHALIFFIAFILMKPKRSKAENIRRKKVFKLRQKLFTPPEDLDELIATSKRALRYAIENANQHTFVDLDDYAELVRLLEDEAIQRDEELFDELRKTVKNLPKSMIQ